MCFKVSLYNDNTDGRLFKNGPSVAHVWEGFHSVAHVFSHTLSVVFGSVFVRSLTFNLLSCDFLCCAPLLVEIDRDAQIDLVVWAWVLLLGKAPGATLIRVCPQQLRDRSSVR